MIYFARILKYLGFDLNNHLDLTLIILNLIAYFSITPTYKSHSQLH